MLAVNLSIRLDVLALVRHYHTNKLISHGPLSYRKATFVVPRFNDREIPHATTLGISGRFQPLFQCKRYVTPVFLTQFRKFFPQHLGALAFENLHNMRWRIFGRNRQVHMNMVRTYRPLNNSNIEPIA